MTPSMRWRRPKRRGEAIQTAPDEERGPVSGPGEPVARLFVNRSRELAVLAAVATTRLPQLVFLIGGAGTGKTWTLLRLVEDCRNRGLSSTLVAGDSSRTGLDLLRQVQQGLKKAKVEVSTSDSVWVRYKEKSREAELRLGPLAGNRRHQEQSLSPDLHEEISHLLRSILKSAEDYELVVNPHLALSAALIQDLAKCPPARRPILMIDGLDVDRADRGWLRSFILSASELTTVVVAADRQAFPIPTAVGLESTTTVALGLFPYATTRQCVEVYATEASLHVEEEDVKRVAAFSQGLPLAIRWAMDLMKRDATSDFSSIATEALERISESLLSDTPASVKRLVEVCSIPRWVNEELLERLATQIEMPPREAYALLTSLSLVSAVPRGLALQPEVRAFASRRVKQRSPLLWLRVNRLCAEYHRETANQFWGWDHTSMQRRRDALLELCYHDAESDPVSGLTSVLQSCLSLLERSDLEACSRILAEAQAREEDSQQPPCLDYLEGEIAYRHGDWETARTKLERATSLSVDEHTALPNAAITLGRIQYAQGQLTEASLTLEGAIEGLKGSDGHLMAYAQEQLAKVYRMRGTLNEALAQHELASQGSSAIAAQYSFASSLGSWGTTLLLAGKLEDGVRQLGRSIEISQKAGYLQFECTGKRSRAVGLQLLGRLAAAKTHAQDALRIALELGDVYNQGFARYVLASIECELSPDSAALDLNPWEAALADLSSVHADNDEANARLSLAGLLLNRGELEACAAQLEVIEPILQRTGFQYGHCLLDLTKARLLRLSGNYESAIRTAAESRARSSSIGAEYLLACSELESLRIDAESGPDEPGIRRLLAEVRSATISNREQGYWALAWQAGVIGVELAQAGVSPSEEVAALAVEALGDASHHNGLALVNAAERVAALLQSEHELSQTVATMWESRNPEAEVHLAAQLGLTDLPRVKSILVPSVTR